MTFNLTIMTFFLSIASLHLNCELKSELWDINSELLENSILVFLYNFLTICEFISHKKLELKENVRIARFHRNHNSDITTHNFEFIFHNSQKS